VSVPQRPLPAPQVDALDLDGEVLLYDGERLHLLTGSGAMIWHLLDGAADVADVAAGAARIAAMSPQAVEADVRDFLGFLDAAGLIVGGEPGTAYTRPPHVGFVRDDQHVLLLDTRDGRRRALSPTGSRVFELVCTYGRLPPVLDALRAEYAPTPAELPEQVQTLLEELTVEGFLDVTPERDGTGG
jgi:hypothetical protein